MGPARRSTRRYSDCFAFALAALPLDTAAAALSSVMTFSSSPAGDGGGVDRSTNAAPSGTLLGIPMSAREWDGGHISYYNFDPIDKIRPFLLLS